MACRRGGDRPATPSVFNVQRVREDFPILRQKVHGKPLVYLDNAATTQKPQAVLDALQHYYSADNANVHRAVHLLSERATQDYEEARVKVQGFLGAADAREIIFVRGATEGINLVAQSLGRKKSAPATRCSSRRWSTTPTSSPGKCCARRRGPSCASSRSTTTANCCLDEFEKLLTPRTRIVSVAHVSNALGTVNPVKRIVELAHARGVPVLVDGAQSAPHLPIDVRELDCDFFVFSGHKLYGPTGIGVLYGKARHCWRRCRPTRAAAT